MDRRGYRVLIKLGENGCDFGIHKQLGIPRSTLWAWINDLEKETGLTLVIRKKQNNTLTEEARHFIPYAQRMIRLFEEGIAHSSVSSSEETAGEIIISTTTAIASSWLMESVSTFRARYPKIQLKIIADDCISTKTERIADILLRPMAEHDFLLRHWSIPYHMALWASPDYLEKNGTPKQPLDLLNHSILGYGEYEFSYFPDIDWHLKGRWGELPRLRPQLTINSTKSLYLAAQKGIGICSAASESNIFYAGTQDRLVRVLPKIEGPTVHIYFCTKKDASPALARNVQIFDTFFVTYLKSVGMTVTVPGEESNQILRAGGRNRI